MDKNRLKQIRDELGGISQVKLANLIGVSADKIRGMEIGRVKISSEVAQALEKKLHYNFQWVLTGEGTMRKGETALTETASPLYNRDEYATPGIDPALQAMSDIKDIFASGDPILIPAIQANINAFKRALQRERQFSQIIEENNELRERLTKLEATCQQLHAELDRLKASPTTAVQQKAS